VTSVNDEEFGGPVRMQNVVGKLSRTPGSIRHAGPRLGHHNREILIERLGFDEEEVKEEGLPL
ncbi:MAG TPA: CoA transferase, partial [Nitrospinota bacterium]|nr:CoA transferase [Nitrospinota bacterium]